MFPLLIFLGDFDLVLDFDFFLESFSFLCFRGLGVALRERIFSEISSLLFSSDSASAGGALAAGERDRLSAVGELERLPVLESPLLGEEEGLLLLAF